MRSSMLVAACAALMLCLCGSAIAAQGVFPMKTAWLGEHETFLVWYAKQKGWDKDAGLDVQMLRFDSGKSLVDGVLAYDWGVAGCGAIPAMTSTLHDKITVIGVANDESAANTLFARADSPLLKVKGHHAAFPDVYGSPDTVKGKLILCPRHSSAHYLLDRWLAALGMTEKDVRVRYMEPTPALGGFNGGLGDVIALWAPFTGEAEKHGLKAVARSVDCGARQPVLLVANRRFAKAHPQEVTAFLGMYLKAVDTVRTTPPETLAIDYSHFYKEWTGRDMDTATAIREIVSHPVFSLTEQIALFKAQGEDTLSSWLKEMVFFVNQTDGSVQITDTLFQSDFLSDRFLLRLSGK